MTPNSPPVPSPVKRKTSLQAPRRTAGVRRRHRRHADDGRPRPDRPIRRAVDRRRACRRERTAGGLRRRGREGEAGGDFRAREDRRRQRRRWERTAWAATRTRPRRIPRSINSSAGSASPTTSGRSGPTPRRRARASSSRRRLRRHQQPRGRPRQRRSRSRPTTARPIRPRWSAPIQKTDLALLKVDGRQRLPVRARSPTRRRASATGCWRSAIRSASAAR